MADLTPDPRNARKHGERNVETIAAALTEVGAARSIVIDEQGVILAGNATVEAAAKAGIAKLQVVDADGSTIVAVRRTGLTPEQKARLALFDNRAAELAEGWDTALLAELRDSGVALDGLWNQAELARLLPESGNEAAGAPPPIDRADELRVKWETAHGQLWTIGPHRLLCGDATEDADVGRLLNGAKADMVFTDPPYGVNVTGKGGDAIAGDISFTAIPLMFDVLSRILAPGAWVYVCGGQSNMLLYSRMFERYFRQLPRLIVWDKGRTAVLRQNGYHSCYELIYWSFLEGGGGRWYGPRDSDHADDIWRAAVEHGDERLHVTQKPASLAARAIGNTCPPGGLVFEPFSGSGSTLIGAEQQGRRCYAMELEPKYVAVALERLAAMGLTPELAK